MIPVFSGLIRTGLVPLPLAALGAAPATANPLLWYVTRAAAVSAYITLTVTVILGMARSLARVTSTRVSWMLDEVHQFLAVLVAAFVGLHLLSLLFDPLIPFAPLNLLVPLDQPYRPFAVDLGVLAVYGLVIVLGSSWLRRRIAYASWRTLHYTSFAVFALVTLHGILAGSDAGQPWMRLVYLVAGGLVGLLVFLRMFWPQDQPSQPVSARRPV
jgi:methionine sulfoxide reductase heme-binding subunit